MGRREERDAFGTLEAERMFVESHPIYDVCAHGATGDGSTDDTAPIQSALDTAEAGGGGVVYLPAGTYHTTYTLLYGSDLMIYGPAATIAFEPSHENATALVSASFDGSVETSRVTIQGLAVEAVDPEKGNGIGMAKAEDMAVKACQTHGLNWHLVDIAGAKNVLVSDCYASNLETAAYQADNLTSEGGLVVEHSDGTTEGAVVDGTNNQNVDIEGNVAETCGRGVHFHRDGGHDLTVRDNKIRGCTDVGILGDANMDWHDVIITGNIVEGNGNSSGIRLDGEYSNLSVENNTVRNHDAWGIAVHPDEDEPESPSKGVTIRNNTVKRVDGTAIELDGAAGEIANNYIYNVARGANAETTSDGWDEFPPPDSDHTGVSVVGCDGVTVRNNIMRDLGGTGVVCRDGTTNVVVSDNGFTALEWAVVLLSNGDPVEGAVVEHNRVIGGPSSHGGVRVDAGRNYRIGDNTVDKIEIGVSVSDATDLRLTNNGVTASDSADIDTAGYRIRDSTAVVARDNDATGFAESMVIDGNTTEVRAEIPSEGLHVGPDCEGIVARFEGPRPPENGVFAVGSRVRNTVPAAGGHLGWVCVVAGSPGVWKPFGRIEDDGSPPTDD